jgi:hypothetical protein
VSQVSCIGCNTSIELAKADLTGRGYRCSACSLKASLAADGGRNDVRDHLTDDERRARHTDARKRMFTGGWIIGGGILVTLGYGALFGLPVVFLGIGTISHGYLTRREMHGERTN